MAYYPIILVVNPALPVGSVPELIARAKADPGGLTFGHSGYGGGTHLAGELFAMEARVQLRQVPYKGSAPAMADLLGGHVDLMFSDAPTALPYVQSGRLRALGISTPRRSELLPDLPTIAEAGVPGYGAYSWGGISVRAGTPPEIGRAAERRVRAPVAGTGRPRAPAADRRGAATRHARRVRRHDAGRDRQVGRRGAASQDPDGVSRATRRHGRRNRRRPSMTRPTIAVIGAGIGGLAAAALLHRRGYDVQVYEQAKRFARIGAGIQQSANSTRILRALGLEPRLREAAFQPNPGTTASGTPVR